MVVIDMELGGAFEAAKFESLKSVTIQRGERHWLLIVELNWRHSSSDRRLAKGFVRAEDE